MSHIPRRRQLVTCIGSYGKTQIKYENYTYFIVTAIKKDIN